MEARFLLGVNRHTYWVMPLHSVELALWGKLFGFSVRNCPTFR